ncbi:MAG TPA: chemotaxis response regulator protein-glutamate methylesterase [Candidatus Methanoperedenaceae archaeon]|nr:chemotaxis response regulator protein-glutamate methylesterase [Candidatus Methanoperedenaceae archaeon]
MSRIRVLVVDDSALMRKMISDMLADSEDIEVIARASNGMDAIEKVTRLKPDVVTMDIEMPVLDGLNALGYIMSECPTHVIMLSTESSADVTIKAINYGAVDFIPKPSGSPAPNLTAIKDELIRKVRAAALVEISRLRFIEEKRVEVKSEPSAHTHASKVVVIGTSTGGPRALHTIISRLPPTLNAAVLVVQHMPPGFTRSLADRLNCMSMLRVREAREGDLVVPGAILIAPGDYHMTVKRENKNGRSIEVIALNKGEKVQSVRPSVDVLLNSVIDIYGKNTLGVILTGMGSDGSEGIRKLKKAGGKVIAEHESTCVVYGMPRTIVEQKLADYVLPIEKIAEGITQNT